MPVFIKALGGVREQHRENISAPMEKMTLNRDRNSFFLAHSTVYFMMWEMNKKIGLGIIVFFCLCLFGSAFLTVESPSSAGMKATRYDDSPVENPDGKMLPHKALYEISMVSSSNGSQIINISGNMYFEWKPTCDAWVTDHRFNLTYEYSDSPAMRVTSDFSTWESRDGQTFNFSSRRSRDGDLYEEIRGQATRNKDGTGKAVYTMPTPMEFDLPKDFVFPMQHTLQLSRAIGEKNVRFMNRTLFDGSDMDGPIEVNAFIGKEANAIARIETSPQIDIGLLNGAAKDVQMAFFPLMDEEVFVADYEMDALFHENSVISDMYIDYNEFSIRQKLVALEKLDVKPVCK